MQGDVLDAVEQAVELGVITDAGGDARGAVAAFDDGTGNYGGQQRRALAAQDDPVPVVSVAPRGLDGIPPAGGPGPLKLSGAAARPSGPAGRSLCLSPATG